MSAAKRAKTGGIDGPIKKASQIEGRPIVEFMEPVLVLAFTPELPAGRITREGDLEKFARNRSIFIQRQIDESGEPRKTSRQMGRCRACSLVFGMSSHRHAKAFGDDSDLNAIAIGRSPNARTSCYAVPQRVCGLRTQLWRRALAHGLGALGPWKLTELPPTEQPELKLERFLNDGPLDVRVDGLRIELDSLAKGRLRLREPVLLKQNDAC